MLPLPASFDDPVLVILTETVLGSEMEFLESFKIAAAELNYEKPPVLTPVTGSAKETPYYFHVATDTDPTVFIPSAASVIVTLVVGVAAIMFQRRQVRANITNFRHQWMVELRGCAAEYLQAIYSAAWSLVHIQGFKDTPEYIVLQNKLAVLTFKIELLLSRDDASTAEIFKLDQELCDSVYDLNYGDSLDVVFEGLVELRKLFRIELEDAWIDVQIDLSARKRKVRKSELFNRLSSLILQISSVRQSGPKK